MKYENKKNGSVAEVIEENAKTKTVTLMYEDGKTTNVTTSTLKRWWKALKEDETAETNDDPVIDEQKKQEVTEVLKKAVADKKAAEKKSAVEPKAKEVKKSGKKKSGMAIEDAHKLIKEHIKKAGLEPVINEKNPKTVWIVINGKKTSGVYVGGSKCVLGLPEKMVPKGYKADRIRNCAMSHSFDVAYDDMDKLTEILSKIETMEQEGK